MFKIDDSNKTIYTSLKGKALLDCAQLNKDCAFSKDEREQFTLQGLLPLAVESMDEQVIRHFQQLQLFATPLQKSIYLHELCDRNEALFYKLVATYMDELLPIIYTPTVGELIQNYSLQFRRSRGLYISYKDKDNLTTILANRLNKDVDMIVVSDGSAILGIGDQGLGGVEITIGKLMVYTAVGGINPKRVLGIGLDVGTNNEALLNDPHYLGWHHKRIEGKDYDDFISSFVEAVRKLFPDIFLHWEDFDRHNSLKILSHYRKEMCTFNDDIQGTGAVTLACIFAALKQTGGRLSEQRIVFHGAGSASVGIGEQLVSAMITEGLSKEQALKQIWMLNSKGLITTDSAKLTEFQQPFAKNPADISSWQVQNNNIDLLDVVINAKPTILIGCSTVFGAFNEDIVKTMAKNVERPIILPLSNPSSKSEALPEDVINWTQGKVLVATGSPFAPVKYADKTIEISQCNNAFVYPGIGLGIIAAKATRVTDEMLRVASDVISQHVISIPNYTALLPRLSEYPELSKKVALTVAIKAKEQGVAAIADEINLEEAINNIFWQPEYYSYEYVEKL